MKTTTTQMIKVYELRFKDTNELIVSSIEERVTRSEFVNMKQDGEDMTNVYGCENFIPVSEWNNTMLSASN